jgi:hypothetical protein
MEHRFIYSASAVGLSGTVVRPTAIQIPAQASSSLGPTGGIGRSRVENFDVPGLVSFTQASSELSGSRESDGLYRTLAGATVEQLNVMDMVTADRIRCQLAAQTGEQHKEPSIVVSAAIVENLRILGEPVKISWEPSIQTQLTTYQSVLSRAQSDKKFRSTSGIDLEDMQRGSSSDRRPVLCTIVLRFDTLEPHIQIQGNCIQIPNFGRLFVGEMLICPESRSLTMLRFQLGSPVKGDFTAASAMANGVRYP